MNLFHLFLLIGNITHQLRNVDAESSSIPEFQTPCEVFNHVEIYCHEIVSNEKHVCYFISETEWRAETLCNNAKFELACCHPTNDWRLNDCKGQVFNVTVPPPSYPDVCQQLINLATTYRPVASTPAYNNTDTNENNTKDQHDIIIIVVIIISVVIFVIIMSVVIICRKKRKARVALIGDVCKTQSTDTNSISVNNLQPTNSYNIPTGVAFSSVEANNRVSDSEYIYVDSINDERSENEYNHIQPGAHMKHTDNEYSHIRQAAVPMPRGASDIYANTTNGGKVPRTIGGPHIGSDSDYDNASMSNISSKKVLRQTGKNVQADPDYDHTNVNMSVSRQINDQNNDYSKANFY
ncbi:hypothetical protein ACF0H5_007435 [Mactra antiquata]